MLWSDPKRIFTIGDRRDFYPGMLTTRKLVISRPDGYKSK
ncbi:hypothetical protein ACPOL_2954 [Acidisarcina polymorpha]|uniref:Uncharacterized protein n=1 Tax=Acidisarcina polymorpha TaxID=2211140 RepID=A0A2Z5G0Z5_9BACT|nr:hypothetical protein ACPOL_2954 [Acidisarcina polymorpha]